MATPVRVLLVDEDPDVLDVTRTFLEREDDGFAVTTAGSVEEALAAIEREPFDAVVSDYRMPRMNGIEMAAAVRERRPGVPFILFTARENEALASDLAAADVTGHVQKGTGTEQYSDLAAAIREAV